MSDVEWPDPVDFLPIADALPGNLPAAKPADQHRKHENAGGDPACPMCVFTPDGFQTQNCRSCTAPIVWAVTDDNKMMPVDAGADPEGNVVLSRSGFGAVRVTVLDQDALFGDGTRRKSHFATCPDGDAWRSKRVGQR